MTFKTRLKTVIHKLFAVICVFSGIQVVLADKVFISPLEDVRFAAVPLEHNYYNIEGQTVLLPCTGSTPDSVTNWIRINNLNTIPTSSVLLRADANGHQQTPGPAGTGVGTESGSRTISDFVSVQDLQRSRNTNLPQTLLKSGDPHLSFSLNAHDLKQIENIPHIATTITRNQQYLVGNVGPVVLRNGSLLILDSKPVDSGWYQCRISSNQQSLFSNITKISIQPYPVDRTLHNLIIAPGSSIELNCLSQPHLPASYSWAKNTMKLPQPHSLSFQTYGVLQLNNITDHDSGEYQCQTTWLDTGAISTITSTLRVISQDVNGLQSDEINWINIPEDTTVVAGDTVIIQCLANISNSFVNYTWSRKDGRTICTETCTSDIISGNLYLYNITLNDNGVYICTVSNGEQISEKSAKITIYSLPKIEVNYNELRATLGKNVDIITCTAAGVPAPMLAWYKNGVKVEGGGRVTVQELVDPKTHKKYLELKIRHFSIKNEGKYQCLAQNIVGTDVQTVSINFPAGEYNASPQSVSVSNTGVNSLTVKWSTKNQPNSSIYLVLYESDTSFSKAPPDNCDKHWCTATLNDLDHYTNYSITVQSFVHEGSQSLESEAVHIITGECILPKPVHTQDSRTIVLGSSSAVVMWPHLPPSKTCGRILYYKLIYGLQYMTESIEVRVTNEIAQNKYVFATLDGLSPESFYVFEVLAATRVGLGHRDGFEAKSFNTKAIPESRDCDPVSNQFVVEAKFVNEALEVIWEINSHSPNLSYSVQLFDMNEKVIHTTTTLTTGNLMLIDNLDARQMYGVTVSAYSNGKKGCLQSTTAVYPGSFSDENAPEITMVEARGPGSLKVEWVYQPAWFADQPVKYYMVRYTLQDGVSQYINSNTTAVLITGLKTYSKYEIVVRAVFESGRVNVTRTMSPLSKGVLYKTASAAPSSAPVLLDPSYDSHFIFVTWKPPIEANGKISNYMIEYDNVSFYKNSSDCFTNITCVKPGLTHSIKVAAVNKDGMGVFSQPIYLYPPHNFVSSCPSDVAGSYNTTQAMNTPLLTSDNSIVLSVILGCSIIIFVIFLAVLMICCCCYTRKFDRIKCSWCKRSANNLKKCNTKQNESRMYTNNRDSGICLSQDTPQNGLLLKPVNKKLTKNGSISNGHATKPLLRELNEVNENRYHHHAFMNGNGVKSFHQTSTIPLKRSKSALLHRQADNVISILFNKEKGKSVKQQEDRKQPNGYLLSVPIPRHTYDYLTSSKTTSELDSDPIEVGSSLSSSVSCSNHETPSSSNSKSSEQICENHPLLDEPITPPNGIIKFPHLVVDERTNHKRPLATRPLNSSTSSNTSDYSSESPNASDEKLFQEEFSVSPPSKLVEEMTSLWSDKYGGFKIDV